MSVCRAKGVDIGVQDRYIGSFIDTGRKLFNYLRHLPSPRVLRGGVWMIQLSDPAKLLVMFGVSNGPGIEETRLPYYVFLLSRSGCIPFVYRFTWASEPFSETLNRDIENMVAAGLVGIFSPIKILDRGEQFLESLGEENTSALTDALRPYLEDFQKSDIEQLHQKASILLTS